MEGLTAYLGREVPVINEFLEAQADALDGLVRDIARHVLLCGGKRIRPALTMLTARAYGFEGDILPLACALEMLHSATLLHDDILDGAELRRGKTASHLVFGHTETILAGDVLLALANKLGAGYGKARISAILADGIMATATGEILELAHAARPRVDRRMYMDIIIGKTARLIETACRCGAAAASDDPAVEDLAGEYGLNLGIAFQLVDDALDYVSPSDTTGKPEGGDLREGKLTLPLILFLEAMPAAESEGLLARMREGGLNEDERRDVIARIKDGGYAGRTRDVAGEYIATAESALARMPDCPECAVLRETALYVLHRSK